MEGTRQRDIKGGRRGITPLPSTLMTRWLPRHLVSFDHLSTMTTVYLDLLWLPLLLLGKASIFSVVTHYSYVCLRAVVYCIGSPQSMYDWLVCGKCPMVGVEWWARRSVADGRGQEPDPSIPSLCGHAVARLALVAPSADRRTEYLPQMIKRVLDLPIVIRALICCAFGETSSVSWPGDLASAVGRMVCLASVLCLRWYMALCLRRVNIYLVRCMLHVVGFLFDRTW